MATFGSKTADDTLLLALACGATIENAARKANVGMRTAYRRVADPEFQKQLKQVRTEMVQRATAMLSAAAMEGVKTMIELLGPTTPPAVRLGSARSIVELGVKLRESNELAERITALEEQLGASDTGVSRRCW